jgi:hypothetical protein
MSDYYQTNFKAYHEKIFSIDPTSFLAPLAREMFDSFGFKVCDFSSSVSKTGSGEIWMSCVLDKTG